MQEVYCFASIVSKKLCTLCSLCSLSAMPFVSRFEDRSLRFLLYLEWALLGLMVLGEFLVRLPPWVPRSPELNLICLGLFAWMGLYLPQVPWAKVVYLSLEVTLILVASVIGGLSFFFLFCILLVIRSCLCFSGKGQLWISGLVFWFFLFIQTHRLQFMQKGLPQGLPPLAREWLRQDAARWALTNKAFILFSLVLLFALTLLFLQLLVDRLLSERQSRQDLAAANGQLRDYALQIESVAILQERNRIAREIHDALGHSLTALNLHLDAALGLIASKQVGDVDEARSLLREAKQLSKQALGDVRQSVSTLRSDPLAGQSLEGAIAGLVEDFARTTGVEPLVDIRLSQGLVQSTRVALYRIVQEALTNICKYAEASVVELKLREETQTPQLYLSIRDNGRGFDPEQNNCGFGLRGMRERVLALKGKFKLQAAPQAGCQIEIQIPL